MFVTTNHKLGFIHIPKCAGTSVYDAFASPGPDPRPRLYEQRLDMPWSPWPVFNTHTKFRTAWPHKSQSKMPRVFPPPKTWFTVVRNPYARYHSWFYYQQKLDQRMHDGLEDIKNNNKEDLAERLLYWDKATPLSVLKDIDRLLHKGGHWKDMCRIIKSSQWEYIVGSQAMIFQVEKMDRLWQWLKELGTHVEPRRSLVNDDKQGSWQDLNEEVLELIFQRYKRDFRKLGYKRITKDLSS